MGSALVPYNSFPRPAAAGEVRENAGPGALLEGRAAAPRWALRRQNSAPPALAQGIAGRPGAIRTAANASDSAGAVCSQAAAVCILKRYQNSADDRLDGLGGIFTSSGRAFRC